MSSEQIAIRDWCTWAIVRVLEETRCGSVSPMRERTFHKDEEVEMVQWGNADRPILRDAWWTDFDIDGAFIIKSSKVEIVKVLKEVRPE